MDLKMMTTKDIFNSVLTDLKSMRIAYDTWGVEKATPIIGGDKLYNHKLKHLGGVKLTINNINFKNEICVVLLEDGNYFIIMGHLDKEDNFVFHDIDSRFETDYEDLHLTISRFLAKIR